MADANTLDFLNTVAGYLSLVVSTAALVFGIAGYRKAASVKRLDLRLDYRRKRAIVDFGLSRCTELLPIVKQSRLASLSADGLLNSGHKVAFEKKWEDWHKLIDGKINGRSEPEIEGMKEEALEHLLADIEIEELNISDLLKELENSLALDTKNVERRIASNERRR